MKIIKLIREEFRKEDTKSSICNICKKVIVDEAWCWENHYYKHHPGIDIDRDIELLDCSLIDWNMNRIEKVIKRISRKL